MNPQELLVVLDRASVSGDLAPDCRRVLGQEANALRACMQSGGNVGKRAREAAEVARLWGVEVAS